MRKLILSFMLLGGLSLTAQQPASHETASQQVAQEDEQSSIERWKLINTALFAIVLGFGIYKVAPKFFQARGLEIQKAIKDATGLKIEADFRYSQIDKKMANLQAEVARMKAEANAEMERERQRFQDETAEEMAHMARNADYEIESLRTEGTRQVKRHTAHLALARAEQRLQAHFAASFDQNNVNEFIGLVEGRN